MILLYQRKMRVLNRSPFSSLLVRENKSWKESNPRNWCQTQAVHTPNLWSSASNLPRDPMLNQLQSIIQQVPNLRWSRKPSEKPSVSRNKPKPLLKRVSPTSFSSIARRKKRTRKLNCLVESRTPNFASSFLIKRGSCLVSRPTHLYSQC